MINRIGKPGSNPGKDFLKYLHEPFGSSATLYVITNPSAQSGYNKYSVFLAGFIRFDFRVFLLVDRLPYQD